jgi:cyclophilin family peptidyl-prolyl cis-trans isomerase
MKLNRKMAMNIFLLFLFSGSIIIPAFNILMKPKETPAGPVEIAVIETTMGTIEIELDRLHAPVTVENFVNYANAGYYDGLVFHRVISDFMVQGGGFDVEGTFKTPNDPIVNEANNGHSNVRGTISMARTNDPDSATSQFFINTANNTFLDYQNAEAPGYTMFGVVIEGMDVVDEMRAVETATKDAYFPDYDFNQPMEDWPVEDIVITKVTISDS